jgi:hypothetical protein
MIKLFTVCACRSDLIELQLQSFRKHLKDDFEFIIFNNAQFKVRPQIYSSINKTCYDLGLKVIDVRRDQELADRCQVFEPRFPIFNVRDEYSTDGVGNEYSLCWAWENVISKEKDMVCLMHSDTFLIGDLTPSDYLKEYDLCYIPQARQGIREYMWEVFVLMNMSRLPNPETLCWMGGFMTPEIAGDTSCVTSRYLDAHKDYLKIYHIESHVYHNDPSVGFSTRPVYEVLYFEDKPTVLHYTSASNWDNQSEEFHNKKTEWLKKVLSLDSGLYGIQIKSSTASLS